MTIIQKGEPMSDLISRQAAIDALKEKVFSNLTDEFYGAMQVLDELPSAQPETNCSEIPNNSDTISRQQAIEVLRNRWLKTRNYEGIGEDIAEECEIYLKTLPSVQPNLQPTCSQLAIDCISRQAAIDAMLGDKVEITNVIRALGNERDFEVLNCTCDRHAEIIKALPSVQPDEKLEKCRFEYINACQIVTYPTPDTTKKDISDAYAVIKALQPIFGDVPFAKVKRGEAE